MSSTFLCRFGICLHFLFIWWCLLCQGVLGMSSDAQCCYLFSVVGSSPFRGKVQRLLLGFSFRGFISIFVLFVAFLRPLQSFGYLCWALMSLIHYCWALFASISQASSTVVPSAVFRQVPIVCSLFNVTFVPFFPASI